jgi:serine/threonine protein kinase
VYAARDDELDRLVAIKIPHAEQFDAEEDRRQFLEEARTVAKLRHRGIVSVFDVGIAGDGLPFVVLELFERGSLDQDLKAHPATPDRAAWWVADIAEALAEAHRNGFVHRDLKPANILLDTQGRPHITDFGLAVHESLQRSRSGELAGTLQYMSPEQIRGEVHRLDGRSDIWSLGVILYQMLTGRRPFGGDSVMELSDEIEHREPKPPRQLNSELPMELERICLKAMLKAPAERYSTADDMAADLRNWLTNHSTPAASPSPVASRPSLVIPIGIGIVACVIGVFFVTQFLNAGRAPHQRETPQPLVAGPISPADPAAVQLQVTSLDVQHLANQYEQSAIARGILGKNSFSATLRDHITIDARLSRPAYAYLIAFRPDGVMEVCFPEDESLPPPRTDHPRYPSVSRGVDYGLNEGAGLWVFAVVASDEPLPAFQDWKASQANIPWQAAVVPPNTVFVDDGNWVETLTPGNRDRGTRGKGVLAPEKKPVTDVIDWLKRATRAETVRGVGFGVSDK